MSPHCRRYPTRPDSGFSSPWFLLLLISVPFGLDFGQTCLLCYACDPEPTRRIAALGHVPPCSPARGAAQRSARGCLPRAGRLAKRPTTPIARVPARLRRLSGRGRRRARQTGRHVGHRHPPQGGGQPPLPVERLRRRRGSVLQSVSDVARGALSAQPRPPCPRARLQGRRRPGRPPADPTTGPGSSRTRRTPPSTRTGPWPG